MKIAEIGIRPEGDIGIFEDHSGGRFCKLDFVIFRKFVAELQPFDVKILFFAHIE